MELEIQDLIDSIKRDGVEEAQKQADTILANAKIEADKIISDAKKKSDSLLVKAQNEIDLRDQSAKATLSQAARDVCLSLKKSIEEQINKVLVSDINKAMDLALLSKVVLEISKSEICNSNIVINGDDAKTICESLKSELSKELQNGLELKLGTSGVAGIKIASQDGSSYIDLGASECATLLKPYINKSLNDIIF